MSILLNYSAKLHESISLNNPSKLQFNSTISSRKFYIKMQLLYQNIMFNPNISNIIMKKRLKSWLPFILKYRIQYKLWWYFNIRKIIKKKNKVYGFKFCFFRILKYWVNYWLALLINQQNWIMQFCWNWSCIMLDYSAKMLFLNFFINWCHIL